MYNIARRLIHMSVTMFLSRPVGGLFLLLLQFFILARASPIRQSHPHSAMIYCPGMRNRARWFVLCGGDVLFLLFVVIICIILLVG